MAQVVYQSNYKQPKYTPPKDKGPANYLLKRFPNVKFPNQINVIADKAVLTQILILLGISILLGFIIDVIFSVGVPFGRPEFSVFVSCICFGVIYSLASGGGLSLIPGLIWGWLIGSIMSIIASEYFSNEIHNTSIVAGYVFYIFCWSFAALGGIAVSIMMNFLLEKYIRSYQAKESQKNLIFAYVAFLMLNIIIYFLFNRLFIPYFQSLEVFSKISWYFILGLPISLIISISSILKYKQLNKRDGVRDIVSRTLYGSPSSKYDIPLTNLNLQFLSWTDQKKYKIVKAILFGICLLSVLISLTLTGWVTFQMI